MKSLLFAFISLWAASVSAAISSIYATSPTSLDNGGVRITSTNYSIDGSSVGDIGGIVTSASYTARNGYSGQLFEVTNLTISSTSTNLNETAAVALNPQASLSDGSKFSPAVLRWFISGDIASVSPDGLVTAGAVYTNTTGTVWGGIGNMSVSRNFGITDTNGDNFGIYANDGILDSWQVQYFGANNPAGTGSDVLFKYTAGLNPTNPASVFSLAMTNMVGQPTRKILTFSPRYTNRTYTVQYANLLNQTFSNLTLATVNDNGNTRTITDTNATALSRFYRVQISYP